MCDLTNPTFSDEDEAREYSGLPAGQMARCAPPPDRWTAQPYTAAQMASHDASDVASEKGTSALQSSRMLGIT